MKYLLFAFLLSAALFALDYYVYSNWRRFARRRRSRFVWTLPVYRVMMVLMPLTLPIYFQLFRWWQVEPKLMRALFFGLIAVYYLPKVPIAFVLLVKDAARFVTWLFGWFQGKLSATESVESDRMVETAPPPDLTDMKRITRGEFLRRMGWSAAAVPFVVAGYSVFRTLYDFRVHRIDVPIAGLPRAFDGLTIAQLSDLHAGSFFSKQPMEEAVSLVAELKPDLVTITGDFVNHDAAEMEVIAPALHRLSADLGVFGCLGNHDHYADIRALTPRIDATPVDLLVNTRRTFEVDGARLHIIGTDNTGFRQHYADLPRAVQGIDPDHESAQVLLAHDPTFWDAEVRPGYEHIDLMLCGHTHGGQIGLEFGPLRWGLAKVAYDRWAGLYAEPRGNGRSGPQYLYVNRGLGTVGPPLRLGIPPEITLLTLRRA